MKLKSNLKNKLKNNLTINLTKKINTKIENIKANSSLKSEINKLVNQWKEIMAQTNTYNEKYLTFTLSHIKKESYGFSCRIYVPYGLMFDTLEKIKPIIQDNIGCLFFYQKKNSQTFVMSKFVTEGFKNMNFIIPCVKPYEVYIGNAIDGSNVIIDLRKYPHILLSGANGSGKSRLLDCLLTTLLFNCSEQEIETYLIQIAKNDMVIYEDCIQCRAFCDDLKKTNIILEHIVNKMYERSLIIKPLRKKGKGSDISDYNKIYPNNKMSYVYVVFDEYASITDTSNDDKDTKLLKQQIIGRVERIAQYGRALGVFFIISIQRPQYQMLSPFVKSQSNLRISGNQNNQKSSEIAMDDPYAALNLEQRTFVYHTYDFDYIKTPYIDDKIILDSLKDSIKPNHRTLFSDMEKLNKDKADNISPEGMSDAKETKGQGKVTFDGKDTKTNSSDFKPNAKEKDSEVNDSDKDTKESNTTNKDFEFTDVDYTAVNFDKVDPDIIIDKETSYKENIKDIANFVPYIDYDKLKNIRIIDRKNPCTKTSKPIKGKGSIIIED